MRTDTPGVSHSNIVHWDDVEEHDHEEGGIHSAWRYLGEAAGTVGGTTYGVAKGSQLVAVRVLNCAGEGDTAGVVAGIDWVTANAVKPAPSFGREPTIRI